MNPHTTLSIVVPMYNEEGNVHPLVEGVVAALGDRHRWELLLVDDGSSDGTAGEILAAAEGDARVRPLLLARQGGQTGALQAGLDRATGEVVVTMDGDLQNDPADIPALVEKLEEGYDLVAGFRERRQDALITRKVPSWVANWLIRLITGVPIRDNGCSLKAYRQGLVKRLHLYSDLHRFIPAVAVATAGARVAEIPVRHHPRRVGASKYGLSRTGKVLTDLLVITVIRSCSNHPLILFAAGGALAFLLAAAFAVAAAAVWVWYGVSDLVFPSITAVLVGLGVFLVILGLLAETAVFHARAGSQSSLLLLSSPGSEGGEAWER
jgi:glycosyltransferase involved in cell wall biosynthesis